MVAAGVPRRHRRANGVLPGAPSNRCTMTRSRLVLALIVVLAASVVGCRAGDRGAGIADTTSAPDPSTAAASPAAVPPTAPSPTVGPEASPAGTPVAPQATPAAASTAAPAAPTPTPAPVALPDLTELERLLEEIDAHLAEASAAGLEEGSN